MVEGGWGRGEGGEEIGERRWGVGDGGVSVYRNLCAFIEW